MDDNTVVIIILCITVPFACFLYLYLFRVAIIAAVKEHQGEKRFNRLFLVAVILPILIIYAGFEKPFSAWYRLEESSFGFYLLALGFAYITIEIPFQLVKSAAKSVVDDIEDAGEGKRNLARMKSAEELAAIISQKLELPCELQAFSANEEFVFLTYILNNKPYATRLKLKHADNAENWKKLGERIMQNYQTEASSPEANPSEASPS